MADDDIRGRIAEKQKEMNALQVQLRQLNQQRIVNLYPGRCFQYCIDKELATQEELVQMGDVAICQKAEEAHFLEVASKMKWATFHNECDGWDGTPDGPCACGAKRYYWMYETVLPLSASTISQSPGASDIEK